ncbi:MAG TPA: class I SAM-dependent methyltransferase [Acidimicrobiales bacterium]|nr:class I SAM-dependent methyltransferase [Acidimicrobiales bacterium]
MLHENRRRAEIFGDDAEQYDRSRPHYPRRLIDYLVGGTSGGTGLHVLDVGCGTGIVARQLLGLGCEVLGVEADERMAAFARQRGIEVEVSRFESWEDRGRRFDLLTAGQSWHWVDPDRGADRAAQVLEPGGRIAMFWNIGRPPEDVQRAFDEAYQRVAPQVDDDSVPRGRGVSARFESAAGGLRRSGAFSEPETTAYRWTRYYSAAEWLDQVQTHSDHRVLARQTVDVLLDGLGAVIESFGGGFTMSYKTSLVTALRLRGV